MHYVIYTLLQFIYHKAEEESSETPSKLMMFQYPLDVCTQENLELNITHLNLDFEYAAHEAARHFWPDVTIKDVNSIWIKPGTEKYKVLN